MLEITKQAQKGGKKDLSYVGVHTFLIIMIKILEVLVLENYKSLEYLRHCFGSSYSKAGKCL